MERNVEWLNLHHLQCFWLVARRGGLVPASRELHVTPSTVWAQLKSIEERLGTRLLEKRGRRLALTAEGERVARVCDELFALSQEVLAVARGHDARRSKGRVGVVSSVPRFVAGQLLAPVLEKGRRLLLRHGPPEVLLGELAAGALDAVLSDDAGTGALKATATLVATSELGLYCGARLHRALSRGFPRSLDGAPLILPVPGSAQRHVVDLALARLGVEELNVVAEVDDSALMKALAAETGSVMAAPQLVRDELRGYFGLRELGSLAASARYHLITLAGRAPFSVTELRAPRAGRTR